MATLTLHIDVEGIRSGHNRAITKRCITSRNLTPDMHRDETITLQKCRIILHKCSTTVLDTLLCRLEKKTYGDGQLIFHLLQKLGCSEEHGDVCIMAACMHLAFILRLPLTRCLLCNRMGVDICTNSQDLIRRMRPLDGSDHAGLTGRLVRNSKVIQIFHNLLLCIELLPWQLRVRMEITTKFY